MSKTVKIWIIVAVSLIAVGLLLFTGAMIAKGFDLTTLSTAEYETNTYEISDAFTEISINGGPADIEFVLSDKKQCEIVCFEDKKIKHTAEVKGGILTIGTVDNRDWYDHFGFSFERSKMTVYLPQSEYTSLRIKGSVGDMEIPKEFRFKTVDITASTGDVSCYASVTELMKIKLSTGTVRVENTAVGALDLTVTTGGVNVSSVTCEGDIRLSVSTGKTKLTDISCKGVKSNGSTGDIILKNVIASETISVERSTGDVTFEGSDAAELNIRTSTGSVRGTLLTEKVFITETNTGSIDVPKTVNGGKCEIKTSTGDIRITIK